MGWWTTEPGGDLLGDGPLDTMHDVLTHLVSERQAQGRPHPEPEALLHAAAYALQHISSAGGVADPASRLVLEATLQPSGRRLTSVAEDAAPDVLGALVNGFVAISGEYHEVVERRPRLSELLRTLEIGLVPEPERFLLLEPGEEMVEIKVIEKEAPGRVREVLMREAQGRNVVPFFQERIARYEAMAKDPKISKADRTMFGQVALQNRLWLVIARYSRGDDVETVRKEFLDTLSHFIAAPLDSVRAATSFSYFEGYVRALRLVALAVLFEVDDDAFERLVTAIGQRGEDALYEHLVGLRSFSKVEATALCYPHAYASLYEALGATAEHRDALIRQFLDGFYANMDDTYWHDLHLRNEREFFGYWAFSLAAFVKGLNLPDDAFADNDDYPRDLVRHVFQK